MRFAHPALHVLLAVLACAGLGWSPAARADVQECSVVTALPVTIGAPGTYCLRQDFAQFTNTSTMIQINVDNVVLDCQGRTIRTTNDANTGTGIYAPGGRSNVTVRNCVVENFDVGIFLTGSSEPGAFGNKIQDNTLLRTRTTAIYVIGSANRIERNKILQSTGNHNGVVKGIFLYSPNNEGVGNVIRDNVLSDWQPAPPVGQSSAVEGITFFNVTATEVTGNTISGLYANTGQYVTPIRASQTSNATIAGNTVLSPPPLPAPLDGGFNTGIYFSLLSPEQQATVICRDNTVGHFGTDISGCTKSDNTEF
jgi:parallel beta-helix repeat protein